MGRWRPPRPSSFTIGGWQGLEAQHMDRRVVARTRLGEKITLVDYLAILGARERLIKDAAGMLGPNEPHRLSDRRAM